MSMSFNFWYVFAPIGAIVAAWIGYNRSHRNGKYCDRKAIRTAWADPAVAAVAGVLLCILIYAESWQGLCWLLSSWANDALSELFCLMLCLMIPIAVSAIYAVALWKLTCWCSKLGSQFLYCRASKWRDQYGCVHTVIRAADLASVLANVGIHCQCSMPSQTESDAEPMENLAEHRHLESLPSETWVETEVINPDGTRRKIFVPENRELSLKLAMLGYCCSMARLQRFLIGITPEVDVEETVNQLVPETKVFQQEETGTKMQKKSVLESMLEQLDNEQDREIMRAAVAQAPGLRELIESGNITLRAQFVGDGEDRKVRFSSMKRVKNPA